MGWVEIFGYIAKYGLKIAVLILEDVYEKRREKRKADKEWKMSQDELDKICRLALLRMRKDLRESSKRARDLDKQIDEDLKNE